MDCLICQDFSSTRCLVVSFSLGDIVLAAATLKEMSTNKTRQFSQEVGLNQAEEDERNGSWQQKKKKKLFSLTDNGEWRVFPLMLSHSSLWRSVSVQHAS